MKSFLLSLLIGASLLAVSGTSIAQKGRVITLNEVKIVGRVQRPIAAVDVARILPKIALSQIKQSFVNRIEEATLQDPF